MAEVRIRRVKKAFGETVVLHEADLEIRSGEFVVLVGPSGCGKSTLLRLIAGLEEPTAGEISIDGRVVNAVPPQERGVAMVFQNYALYPHMSVRENMAFALRLAGLPKAEIGARVAEAAQVLHLESQLEKKPGQLSGGQKQRVAMGRAMVRRPKVFLFDEPLSNLDAQLRVRMRSEISLLHRRLKSTVVYVTHDQVEAMTLADRVVVVNQGRFEQAGPPLEVYHRPRTRFVAGFMGTPAMNLLPAAGLPAGTAPAGAETVGFRPEAVALGAADGALSLGTASVALVEPLGDIAHVHLRLGEAMVVAETRTAAAPALDAEVAVRVPKDRLHFFGVRGERREA